MTCLISQADMEGSVSGTFMAHKTEDHLQSKSHNPKIKFIELSRQMSCRVGPTGKITWDSPIPLVGAPQRGGEDAARAYADLQYRLAAAVLDQDVPDSAAFPELQTGELEFLWRFWRSVNRPDHSPRLPSDPDCIIGCRLEQKRGVSPFFRFTLSHGQSLGLDPMGRVWAFSGQAWPHGATFSTLDEAAAAWALIRPALDKQDQYRKEVQSLEDEAVRVRMTPEWTAWLDAHPYPSLPDGLRDRTHQVESPWPETLNEPFCFAWRLIVRPMSAYLVAPSDATRNWPDLYVEVPRHHADIGGPQVYLAADRQESLLRGRFWQGSFFFVVPFTKKSLTIRIVNLLGLRTIRIGLVADEMFPALGSGGPVVWEQT